MRIFSFSLAKFGRAGAFAVAALASTSCKRHAAPTAAADSASPQPSASALPAPEEVSVCQLRTDFGLSLEAPAPPAKKGEVDDPSDDEVDDALLPFGVDIGTALPTAFGFAVAGIQGTGQAFIALLGERASRRVDLGELHGEPETPGIAAVGERVLVALRTTDAAGFTIKLGSIAGLESNAAEWGYELTKLGKTVTGVELAADAKSGVLVYQGELKGESRLMLGSFSTVDLKQPFVVKPLEPKDVEMPRLLRRPGGYWLSWVRTLPEPKKPAAVSNGGRAAAQDPEERELLEVGLRAVEVAKLDEHGALIGAPLRVGEPRRQVLLYDVAPLPTGLLVAARSDSASPGAEGGAIVMSQIGADGSVHDERLDDDEIGAGAPALLVDEVSAQAAPWLAVSGPNDATRIGLARGSRTSLRTDPRFSRAEIIAVGGGHFLLQRARGRGVILEALDCRWPPEFAAEK
ncbi:MAG TPA: hypothetical protein VEQ59_23130 [Polyangiaceae bacterium]|nr:hypothetical protein [Polyangiaceae bacterium]